MVSAPHRPVIPPTAPSEPLPAHCPPAPRSSASNRIIGAKDHASIQMNVAEVSREDLCAGEGARSAGLVCVLTSEPRAWS